MTCTLGLFLYPEVETLDLAGPYEVFTTAARVAKRWNPEVPSLFSVVSIARSPEPLRTRAGLMVLPEYTFDLHPPIDLLLVPGGLVDEEMESEETLAWLQRTGKEADLCATVCTGIFLLAKAGLAGKGPVTTHWEDLADLRRRFPKLEVLEDRRWVDTGALVSSAGISAGIDMSLHLVERLAGRKLAEATARQMDYAWNEDLQS